MIYPAAIEQKLGFDAIRELLYSYCQSPLGEKHVAHMKPNVRCTSIRQWVAQVDEFKRALEQGLIPAINEFYDILPIIEQVKIEGAVLDSDSLYKCMQTLSAAGALLEFLSNLPSDGFGELKKLYDKVDYPKGFVKVLKQVFDGDGSIKDEASAALKSIRKTARVEDGRLRSIIRKAFKQAQKDGFVPDGATVSVRESRMVIPINAANKRHIKGFVHDESATGTIVFIEPVESLEANNKIRELELAERREIHKILTQLSSKLRVQLPEVRSSVFFIGIADFIWAKAKLAMYLEANTPQIKSYPYVNMVDAYHPQLFISFKKDDRKIIPLAVEFNSTNRLLLISGPNAGGKSVALKTIGINQYMLQCGLLPCVGADSVMGVFNDIFIDIGDEQSIDNDLSTYSSHLKNMKMMLKHCKKDSLLLIDEFGTGTDPLFGGAIAEAMLEQFVALQCFGAITTHYSNLKAFAEKTDGIVNGAMRFNMEHLAPEYVLEVGRPGSSFALELAQKSGVQGHIIKQAKSKLGADQLDIEKLLNKLERQKQKITERENVLKIKENKVAQLEKKYEQISTALEIKKAEIIDKARLEAANLLKDTNRQIEKTIRHIKESKAEKKETKKVRKSLSSYTKHISNQVSKVEKTTRSTLDLGEIMVGSFALLDDSTNPVEVIEIKGKQAKIIAGNFTSFVKLNRLTKVSNKTARTANRKIGSSNAGFSLLDKRASFSPKLDVRGKRGEEIYSLIDSFINDAVMLDQSEVRVLHGKGSGVLRDIIRQQLKEYPFVTHFEDDHVERGGAGITVISLA